MTHVSAPEGDEERIRQKAFELWESEGHPHGRADTHWVMAREMVAIEDSYQTTLRPLSETIDEPVEPGIALENQGDFPGMADQGEESPHTPHLEAQPPVEAAPTRPVREKPARSARR
jgi:hypothetical protein